MMHHAVLYILYKLRKYELKSLDLTYFTSLSIYMSQVLDGSLLMLHMFFISDSTCQ